MKLKLKPIVATVASAFALGVGTAYSAGDSTRTGSQNQPSPQATTSQPGSGQTMNQQSVGQHGSTAGAQATMADARASKIIGMKVRNEKGEELGDINDLAVDIQNNRIHYAVIGHGGVMGIGEKDVAVPVSRFQMSRAGDELVVNLNEQQLKDAPDIGRDRKNWDDTQRWSDVGRYYNRTLGMPADERTDRRFRRASDLIGTDVIDAKGARAGEIEDLVVNLADGSVHYAVMEYDRKWNVNDKLVALPMASFQPSADKDEFSISMTREQLAQAPEFDQSQWPNLSDNRFRDSVLGFGRDGSTVGMDQQSRAAPSGGTQGTAGSAQQGSADAARVTTTTILLIEEPEFMRLDTDRDGRLSREEVRAVSRLNQNWEKADKNNDGFLTRDEIQQYSASQQGSQPGTVGMDQQRSGSQTSTTSSSATPSGSASGTTGMDRSSTTQSGTGGAYGTGPSGATGTTGASGTTGTTGTTTQSGSATGTTGMNQSTTSQSGTQGSASAGTSGMGQQGSSGQGQSGTSGSAQQSQTIQPSDLPGQAQGTAGASGASGLGALQIDDAQFSSLDKNNDGRLSREEARVNPLLNQQFDQVDNDNDGEVTREELRRHPVNRSGSPTSSSGGQPGTSGGSASGASSMTAGQGSGTAGSQQNK